MFVLVEEHMTLFSENKIKNTPLPQNPRKNPDVNMNCVCSKLSVNITCNLSI